jgi:ribosomal protein S18 acetylase RimI-like enzyme
MEDLMTPVLVRDATPADAERIVRWNMLLAEESEAKQLSVDVLTRGVRRVLADRSKGRYFLADVDGRPAGQTMVTYEWSDWRDGQIWWIQSVYVEPGFRRRGVYRALHRHVIATAKADGGVVGLRLYVERNNVLAQQVYQNCGLANAGYIVFERMFDEYGVRSL